MKLIGACLLAYCLIYGGLRASHILVHRWYVIMKPGETDGKAGFSYWVINDVGHRPFFDAAALRPREDFGDRLLRPLFWPLVETEGLLWTLKERAYFGGGIWFYTSDQRRELARVLAGYYGHHR